MSEDTGPAGSVKEQLRNDELAVTERRRERWARRRALSRVGSAIAIAEGGDWSSVPWHRTCQCGRAIGTVSLSYASDQFYAYVSDGVVTCGSVWSCPVCAAKIRARRTSEIEYLSKWHSERGGELVMVTLTVRHTSRVALRALVEGESAAWRAFQRSALWQSVRADLDGTVRALEVTHGFGSDDEGNGWHPHLHVLLLVKAGRTGDVVSMLKGEGWSVWADRVEKQLGRKHRPTKTAGFRVQSIDAGGAAYVTKIAQEMSRADLKGKGARLPWAIVDALDDGETWAADRWSEYSAAMKGRRAVQWSRGLRDLCGLGAELTDEEIASQEASGDVVEYVDVRTWNRELRNGRAVRRLEAIERAFSLVGSLVTTAGELRNGDPPEAVA